MTFISENWQIISAVALLIFTAGGLIVTFKNKATRRDVYEINNELLEKHQKSCPFYKTEKASKLEQSVEDLKDSFNSFKTNDFKSLSEKMDKLVDKFIIVPKPK